MTTCVKSYKPLRDKIHQHPALERLRASLYNDIPNFSKLRLNEKKRFIREHTDLIRLFAETFGDDACMRLFSLPSVTLYAIKERTTKRPGMTKAEEKRIREEMIIEAIKGFEKRLDRIELRFESVPEIRKEIRETREEFENFTKLSAARVTKMLIEPLIKSLISQYGTKELLESETTSQDNQVIDTSSGKKLQKVARWTQGY